MFCHKCGNKTIEGAAFCPKCETKLVLDEAVQNATQATTVMPMQAQTHDAQDNKPNKRGFKKFMIGLAGSIAGFFGVLIALAAIGNSIESYGENTNSSGITNLSAANGSRNITTGKILNVSSTSASAEDASTELALSAISLNESKIDAVALNKQPEEYIGGNILLYNSRDFSEGRAWTQFRESHREKGSAGAIADTVNQALANPQEGEVLDDEEWVQRYSAMKGDNRAALIDTQGQIIWESELTLNDTPIETVSEFRNGLAYFVFNGDEGSSYNIIDAEGNITFTRDYKEDFIILGHGDGLFLAAEHTADFSSNEWKIGAIDKAGNIVVPFKVYEKTLPFDKPVPVTPPDESLLDSADTVQAGQAYEQARVETNALINEAYEEWQTLARGINNRTSGVSKEEEQAVIRAKEKYDELVRTQDATLEGYDNDITGKENQQETNLSAYQAQEEAYESYLQDVQRYDAHIPEYISFDDDSVLNEGDLLSCEYLGESIYKLEFVGWYILLNIETQNIIFTNDVDNVSNGYGGGLIESFVTNFEGGATTVLYSDLNDGMKKYICRLGSDGSITKISTNDWIQRFSGELSFSDGLVLVEEAYATKTYNYGPVDVYYNTKCEKALEFPEYRETNPYSCKPFYSGYAAMLIMGADGLPYITAINKSGGLMFEPKAGFDAVYTSHDGKYATAIKQGGLTVFDITGAPLISIENDDIGPGSGYYSNYYNVYDGVIKIDDVYVNVEDGAVIGLKDTYGSETFSVIVH